MNADEIVAEQRKELSTPPSLDRSPAYEKHFSEQTANLMLSCPAVALRTCTVSFKDMRGIRHSVDVEAESLYEAAVLAVQRLRRDPWTEQVGNATVLDIEIREPATTHSLTIQQVERWLAGKTTNPNEALKKAKLKMMLVKS
jgi:hypothetical protein